MTSIPSTKDEAFEAVVELAVEALRINAQLKAFDDLKARQTELGQIAGWYLSHPLLAGVDMGQITEAAQAVLNKEAEPAEVKAEPEKKTRRPRRTAAQKKADEEAEAEKPDEVVTATTQESGDLVKDDVEPQSDADADLAWAQAEPNADPFAQQDPHTSPVPADPFAPATGGLQAGAPAPWQSQGDPFNSSHD